MSAISTASPAAAVVNGGCGAPVGGAALDGVDLSRAAVVTGVVRRDGAPLAGAYVRLLDSTGEFTAEVPTGDDGVFRFFAAPGAWTLRTLAPRAATVDRAVHAALGTVAEVTIDL
jgi:hypothetical protein